MGRSGERAVVLGASMSGLLAARVLADHYDEVIVVERDSLPEPGHTRRGVPQARHAHVLLPSGGAIIDELFPGLLDALAAESVPVLSDRANFRFSLSGHVFTQEGEPYDPIYQPSRALLEGRIAERLRAVPQVEVREGYDVLGLVAGDAGNAVTGARVQRRVGDSAEERIDADLVVAATGRSGRSGHWLGEMGYDPPAEEELKIDLMYVSCRLSMPVDRLGVARAVLTGPTPERPTGMAFFVQEHGVWMLTAAGYGGHHPPTEWPALLDFLRSCTPPEIVLAIEEADRLTDLHTHRFPANLRRRYDRMTRFPAGYLVIGDAVCSFNPIYGQGMSVAAMESVALRNCLDDGGQDLATRFFKQAAKDAGVAWDLATGADLSMPCVEAPRPLQARALNTYVDRIQAAAESDPDVARQFLRVTWLLDPPTRLMHPTMMAKVMWRSRRRRSGAVPVAAAAEGPQTDDHAN
ncbi:MAG: FAD-dependent oxidoreductase [Nocardioidaceae bacterium]